MVERERARERGLVARDLRERFQREDLGEPGERVLAFVEPDSVLGGGDRLVELAGRGERGRVDADGIGLAGKSVAIERADAQRLRGLVEVEQYAGVVIVDPTAKELRRIGEQCLVLVAGDGVATGTKVELGGPERELAA